MTNKSLCISDNVLWTDLTLFRIKTGAFIEKNTNPNVKPGEGSVMFLACFAELGTLCHYSV